MAVAVTEHNPLVGGNCLACGSRLLQKSYPGGSRESSGHLTARKFCNHACMGKYAAPNGPSPASLRTRGRTIARRRKRASRCERCGKGGRIEVHHRDLNPDNNEISNLEALCVSCHKADHKANRVPVTCRLCGRRQKCKGLCSAHYQSERNAGRKP